MEKLGDFVGEYIVPCSFRSVTDNFLWAFESLYGPNVDNDRRYGRSLLAYIAGGIFPSVLVGTSMLLDFLVNNLEATGCAQQLQNFQIAFFT